jgi:hypothetical protein
MNLTPTPFKKIIRDQCIGKLGLCACGSNTDYEIVLMMLDRSERNFAMKGCDESLTFYAPAEDASGRWVEFAAKILDAAGLIEHGTGIGSSWLTDTGKASF